MRDPIRVVIAEDHYLFREGVRQLLEASGDVVVISTVGDAASLLDAVARLRPDAVIVDIRMPPRHETEGLAAARTIRSEHPDVGVVVLSQYANALYAFEMFREGTAGLAYLLKHRVGDVDELLRAVVTVARGGSVIDPHVVERLLAHRTTIARAGIDRLTDREADVLALMAQGGSNQAIAGSLHISQSAVEKHVTAIMSKLGLAPGDGTVNRRVAAVLRFLSSYDRQVD